ncbi:hypothetical protein [Sphingomonas sp. S2-65]|uniref:hypothetical protein n=1 Tax=Sphingomonas sp. S2-65 TaxID=2903960 RepID=UPI001F349667|nr:hypothetical protein [Sphingomonas sp. S2-65]UYY57102.1 hypothetical protein LZ586_10420 [Sphingomonas sp. S2-65]
MAEHVDREEWEALRLLNRESGAAPGPSMVDHLQRRGLVDGQLLVTDTGRASLEEYAGAYPERQVRRTFIGSGRR